MYSSYDFSFPDRLLQGSGSLSDAPSVSMDSWSHTRPSSWSFTQQSDVELTTEDDYLQDASLINGQLHYIGPYSPPAVSFSPFPVDQTAGAVSWDRMTGNDDFALAMNRIDGIDVASIPMAEPIVLDSSEIPVSHTINNSFEHVYTDRSSPEVPLPSYLHSGSSRIQPTRTSTNTSRSSIFHFRRRLSTQPSSPSSSLEGQANTSTRSAISGDDNNDGDEGGARSRFPSVGRSVVDAIRGERSFSPEIPVTRSANRRSSTRDSTARVMRFLSRSDVSRRISDVAPHLETLFAGRRPQTAHSTTNNTAKAVSETGLNASSKRKMVPKIKETMQKLGIDNDQPRSSRAMTPDKCSICLEVPTKLTASLTFPCLHTFCDDCISHWVKTKNSCPNCQANVTRIVYNLRSEHDYDVKSVEEKNELMNSGFPPDGDFFDIFWQLHRHRLERQRQSRAAERTYAPPPAATRMIPAGRGNPYINQNPIREAYQVASLYDRAFYDQPNAQVQAQVLVNGFEVSRVEFRRRVYCENLQGGVGIQSMNQVRRASPHLPSTTTNYFGYWDRLQPWLRREITAAMVPEVSNAQREHAFSVMGHVMRSPTGVEVSAFASAVANFMPAARALYFWDEMSQFLLSRTQMGVWDRAMKYFDRSGDLVTVISAAVVTASSGEPVQGRDYVVYDVEETENADSDDDVQFIGTVLNNPSPRVRPITVASRVTRVLPSVRHYLAMLEEDDSMNGLDEIAGAHISDVFDNALYTSDEDGDYRPLRRDLQHSESDDSDNADFMEVLRRTGSSARQPTRAIREEPSRSSRYSRLRRLAREGRHRGRRDTTSEESISRSSSRSRRRRSTEPRSRPARTGISSPRRTEQRHRRLERRATSDRRSSRDLRSSRR